MSKNFLARILIVDDEAVIRRTFKSILETENYDVDEAADGVECLAKVKQKTYDVIFLDIRMPRMDGMEALEKIQNISPDSSVIMISGHGNIETAIESVRKGAFDYLAKPLDLNRIHVTIRNALDRTNLITEAKVLKRKVDRSKIQDIIGDSPAILKIKENIEKAAQFSQSGVMIIGPNGSGKELVARHIHAKSDRAENPFVEVNCAAIPSELVESILFGHVKGSFTGAIKDQSGKFEQATGGTIFLDEIGDMSIEAQAKILRALQERKISRVGSEKDISVDVRVLAATNKNLRDEIAAGRFREDLYHRIEVLDIYVPSLNERTTDIPILVDHFMKLICEDYGIPEKTLTVDALIALQNIDWTGNVRQLRNVIERLIIYCGKQVLITDDDVRTHIKARRQGGSAFNDLFEKFDTVDELLRFMASEYVKYKGKYGPSVN
jgi:two-component system, NtrC family, nitrogen regulation response regulator NtrX